MKCSNCGNVKSNSLYDEGDTIYCSKCTHRTNKSTKKDDSVICPVCRYPRDRKAAYCRWCNDSTWGKYDSDAEKLNKEYKKRITDDNLAYRKYKNYKPKKDDCNDYDSQEFYTNSPDVDSENIGTAIGVMVAAGYFLYCAGKKIYKNMKKKKNKTKGQKNNKYRI